MRIRPIPNEKSDAKDSQWIAELCSNGQIKKSRIFSNDDRNLRIMTRTRSGYVKTRTQLRNRRMLIKDTLDLLDNLESKVEASSLRILDNIQRKRNDLAIVMSVPGIGFLSGSIILAEIGDYRDFNLVNQEIYEEPGYIKRKPESAKIRRKKSRTSSSSQKARLDDKVAAIVDAFYHLNEHNRKDDPNEGRRALPGTGCRPVGGGWIATSYL